MWARAIAWGSCHSQALPSQDDPREASGAIREFIEPIRDPPALADPDEVIGRAGILSLIMLWCVLLPAALYLAIQ